MKKVILTISTVVIGINLLAQEISKEEWRQMSKKERKEYKMAAQMENHQITVALLESPIKRIPFGPKVRAWIDLIEGSPFSLTDPSWA